MNIRIISSRIISSRIIFPLAALGLLTIAMAAASRADLPADTLVGTRIADFPVVTVRPTSQDAAYFRAHRIVDLPRITVHPESADLALFLADNTARAVHLPVLLPQASVLDRQMAASNALAVR